MDQSSSGNEKRVSSDSSFQGNSARSRRNRVHRKRRHTAENRQNQSARKSRNKAAPRNVSQDSYTLPGFSASKDLQKTQSHSVEPDFFADLKTTPDQPLFEDSVSVHMDCCYCHQPIREMSLAIDVPDQNEPAHFECVIEKLKNGENLRPEEKLIYMGNRKFAVVVYKDDHSFEIVREIPFEETRDFKPWRNEFSVRMRKQLE